VPDPQTEPGFAHLVVLMGENRSFDNLLGYLYEPGAVPRGQAFEGVAGKRLSNPIPAGADEAERGNVPVAPGVTPDNPNPDPGEGYPEVNVQLYGAFEPASNGNPGSVAAVAPYNLPTPLPAVAPMSGFVTDYIANYVWNMGKQPTYDEYRVIMDCFPPTMLPATTGIAKAFAVCDHWHCAAPTQTFCNRSFFHAASSSGAVLNEPYSFWIKENTAETIFDRIDAAKNPALTWKIYFYEQHVSSLTALLHYPRLQNRVRTNVFTMQQFLDDAHAGRLPSYSFIEPRMLVNHNDMHPPVTIAGKTQPSSTLPGDVLVNLVYDTIRQSASPTGSNALNTLLVITFDEHGGCYDHVPPPAAVPPTAGAPAGQMDFRFDRFGVRVPTMLVSAYIEPGTVVSAPLDHCSILKTIENKWGLGHLTERDRAASDIGAAITRTTPRPAADWPAFTAARPASSANRDRPLNKLQRDRLGLAMAVSGNTNSAAEHRTIFEALRYLERVFRA
jgi:phospholipase C